MSILIQPNLSMLFDNLRFNNKCFNVSNYTQ